MAAIHTGQVNRLKGVLYGRPAAPRADPIYGGTEHGGLEARWIRTEARLRRCEVGVRDLLGHHSCMLISSSNDLAK